MVYQYEAAIQPGAPARRTRQLVRRLQAAGCSVQYDRGSGRLRTLVTDGEDAWRQTALVTMLLLSYNDVVSWEGHSRRVEERPLARALPPSPGTALEA